MPKMIVVDGPEKSGKSTLLAEIEALALERGYFLIKHHWNKHVPNHMTHKKTLTQNIAGARLQEKSTGRPGLIIWNRSQASEAIYSKLLDRVSNMKDNPLVGEYRYGRAQITMGPRLILLGPDVESLRSKRDPTDLPVDPEQEREAYRAYGTEYRYRVIENPYDYQWAQDTAKNLMDEIDAWPNYETLNTYVGPRDPEYIVLTNSTVSTWLPLDVNIGIDHWAELGGALLDLGYATMEAPRDVIRRAKTIVLPTKHSGTTGTFARYYLNYPESQIIGTTELRSRINS